MKRIFLNENWMHKGQTITLPHDAMLHQQRDPNALCGSAGAFFPEGKKLNQSSEVSRS